MKKTKMLRRLAAMLLAGTMMVAMGTSVFAEGEKTVTLTKKINAEDNVLAPNTSFTFNITNGEAGGIKDGEGKDAIVYAGKSGGAFFDNGTTSKTLEFKPGDELNQDTSISFNADAFEVPGIYHYVVTENPGDYNGMSYSSDAYDMYVYVVNGTSGVVVDGVQLVKQGKTEKTKDIVFENTYTTNNITLKKIVAGNQADMNKKFHFDVIISGQADEKYSVYFNETKQAKDVESGVAASFELGNNDTVTIYGLSANDTYTIEETDYSGDGYKTTIEGAGTANNLTATGNTAAEDVNVTYTNKKEVSTPTGIVMNIAPYVLMVAVAAVLAVVFLRKRNNFEN